MNAESIKLIREMYQELRARSGGRDHAQVKRIFDLTDAQEWAINIFGRDKGLSVKYLAEHIDKVREGMNIGQIAVALGFEIEDAE